MSVSAEFILRNVFGKRCAADGMVKVSKQILEKIGSDCCRVDFIISVVKYTLCWCNKLLEFPAVQAKTSNFIFCCEESSMGSEVQTTQLSGFRLSYFLHSPLYRRLKSVKNISLDDDICLSRISKHQTCNERFFYQILFNLLFCCLF